MRLVTLTCIVAIALIWVASPHAQQTDYAAIKAQAEQFYRDKSFSRANQLYVGAQGLPLPPEEIRWVAFRVADTMWRAQASTQTSDTSVYEKAQQQLQALVRDIRNVEDRDRVWAEVHESLGDFYWTRPDLRNFYQAWPFYQQALDWWAGSPDLDLARDRYMRIVWNAAEPSWRGPQEYYGYHGNYLSIDVLENALKIAGTDTDKAHAHYLIAMTLRSQGSWEQRQRIPEEFEAALAAGRSTDWYDDSLYNYAEFLTSYGRTVQQDGQWRQEYDFIKALQLFRRLVTEFQKGETRYYDQAQQNIEQITRPSLSVGVPSIFVPDSEIQFYLSWRNVKQVDFTLYRVDLGLDVRFAQSEASSSNWIGQISTAGRQVTKSWTKETSDAGDHKPGQEAVRLEKLPIGAYLLEASAGGQHARDLVLVTDATLVLKASHNQALVYVCNVLDGAPVADARVTLWQGSYENGHRVWRAMSGHTNRDGISTFAFSANQSNVELYAGAAAGDRQAFSIGNNYYGRSGDAWRIYAFTDRPAYRPKETAQWKFIARRYDGSEYSTPANAIVEYEIRDPRGTKISDGKSRLNAFGSAWGAVELTEAMPLGEYRVAFWDENRSHHIGDAALFRLEEYKLPEFKVSVRTPEENGKRKTFRLGDKVEVSVSAEYYFGGPVSAANVEVLVYQNSFYHWWHPARDYPWYYEDMLQRNYYRGRGAVIKRETLKTDATGKTTLTFDTPRNTGQDFEYLIEARVTDSSRREIVSSETVRVTRQSYYVYPRVDHYLYRPKDRVNIAIKALDANNQPVQADGKIKITRDYWYEIWIDATGKEVKGDELRRVRERAATFPPLPRAGEKPWTLKFRGYQHDDILTQPVRTDAEGAAELQFTPERDGYYRVAWSSDDHGTPLNAETAVWVATNATTELGYRHGGVEIVVDKDTFRAGQKAPVMLTAPVSNRYILFSVEGDELYSYQLVHLDGTAKLIELDISEKHVPNVFLNAAMVTNRQIFIDNKQVIVPPVDRFLSVDLKPDRDQYEPGDAGTLTVTTRDKDGRPASAEVAMGLVDESVYYIQQDYATDPRQFYYGHKRTQAVQTTSMFNSKRFSELVETENKQLVEKESIISKDRGEPGDRDEDRKKNDIGGLGRGAGAEFGQKAQRLDDLAINGRSSLELQRIQSGVAAPEEGAKSKAESNEFRGGMNEPPTGSSVRVRSDFRSTVIWQPDVTTDAQGKASIKFKYPDSTTGWRATARAASSGSQFGFATAATKTTQPLIVRLQAPRFFLAGDLCTISAVINNNTDKKMPVGASLIADGLTVSGLVVDGQPVKGELGPIEVDPHSEGRVDWAVYVHHAGTAHIKVSATGGKHSDAMEKNFPVYEHGIDKLVAKSGKLSGDEVTVKLDIPAERKTESTSLTVQVAPSMAVTMLDALPYLIDYPYGCTEQTMSRFLPAAITAKTLRDLGIKPEDVMDRVFGGVEPGTALATHPQGKKDLRKLDAMVRQGLDRLYNFQHADGGWGWWKEGESDHFMTAYVLWGFTLARDAGIEVKPDVLERANDFLNKELVEAENAYDLQAWMLHALASFNRSSQKGDISPFQRKAFDNLWQNRERLNAYTRALLALSANAYGFKDRAKTLVENLENGVKVDSSPDATVIERGIRSSGLATRTAHWGEDGIYWRWSDGGVESTAFALRALLAIDPQNKLVEPVTNWLVKNRRGAQWSNTRDTAIAVLTLNDYLRTSGELSPEMGYDLFVNNQPVASRNLTASDALAAPSRFTVKTELIRNGVNEIRIHRTRGSGAIYFATEARFFSLEEPIQPAGNEIFVRRDYYRLVSRPTLLKGNVSERRLLRDGDTLQSGDRVEVVMTIEAKNNYEYLVFEDLKPAGLEAVQVRSGEPAYVRELKSAGIDRRFANNSGGAQAVATESGDGSKGAPITNPTDEQVYTGRSRWVYQELRDRKVALFIDKLPQGVWEIRYELRGETPGRFHALPVLGQAMYVPEIKCNGTEMRLTVADNR